MVAAQRPCELTCVRLCARRLDAMMEAGMTELPDLSRLTHDEKEALIRASWAQVQALTARVAELEAKLAGPPKTPDNSSLPPSQG